MKPSASTQPLLDAAALWETLQAEFDRLNAAHFAGRLTAPEIVISRRKTYGGYYQPRTHRIVISWQAYCEHGLAETLNTFRHEVAHIVHPNHSRAFWEVAIALGATQRYASPPLKKPARKYVYACPACGRRFERRRRIRAASCAACDSRYNPRFALRLVAGDVSECASLGNV